MNINPLANRLSNMVVQHSMNGTLGANSEKAEITDQDYLTLGGAAYMVGTFPEMDGGKEDLDPAAGRLRIAGTRPDDEVVAQYKIDEAKQRTLARVEVVEGTEHYAWSLGMDGGLATMISLEDKGATFKATALTLHKDETKSNKVIRTGSWDELDDGIVFG